MPSLGEVCFQNWNLGLPVLEYGQKSEAKGSQLHFRHRRDHLRQGIWRPQGTGERA